MMIDELQALISKGDPQAMATALDGDTPSDRSKLAKTACKAAKDLADDFWDGTLRGGETWEQNNARRAFLPRQIICAWLATYRLGSLKDVQQLERARHGMNGENRAELFELLLPLFQHHPPDWIEQWVTFQLDKGSDFDWRWVRRLMRAGLCARPTTDNYILKMPRDLDSLRSDPELLQDEIWRLFRLLPRDNSALIYHADVEQADSSGSGSFAGALRQLAAEGLIERQRLVTASLEALQLGRKPNDAIWFYRFHEFLAPSPDERAQCQHLYGDLLASAVPAVVSFALAALNELAKAKRLDGPGFVAQSPRAFEARTKGAPVSALKLLGQIAKEHPFLKTDVAGAACAALTHENPDVQKTAAALLESLKVAPPDHVVAAVEGRLDAVAASLRDRIQELCKQWRSTALAKAGHEPSVAAASSEGGDRPLASRADLDALLTEAAAFDDLQQEQAGIADCLRALEDGHSLSSVNMDPTQLKRLSPDCEQTAIRTLDELIEELSSAIEELDDVDLFERLLDGLSRLCAERPAGFERRTGPLSKRIRTREKERGRSPLLEMDLMDRLISIIRAWLRGTPGPRATAASAGEMEPAPPPPVIHSEPSPEDLARALDAVKGRRTSFASLFSRFSSLPALTFLGGRLDELAARLGRCDARPLLAAPTHRGGWVSAAAFVQRLAVFEQAGLDPQSFDLRQALLRLAPDDRDPILSRATGLTGSRRQAVEWALDKIKPTAPGEAGVYIAAKAGRDPFAPILASDNPPVLVPLSIAWKAARAAAHGDTVQPRWALTVTMNPNAFENPLFRFPPLTICPLAHHAGRVYWEGGKASSLAQLWPINLAPFFAAGAVAVVSELETTSADVRYFPEFLKPMFAPQVPFSETAQLLLAASLLAKSADQRGLAVDLLLAVIEDGRCVGDELGTVLGRLLPSGMVRCNRLAESLITAGRASLLHKWVCARIVESMFANLEDEKLPDDAHHLLAPLLEWLTELNQPLRDSVRRALSAVSGSSKTAKLARSLLQRTAPADASQQRAFLLEALRGRVAAAHRRLGFGRAARVLA